MGGWKLEAFKMVVYMAFPVGVFWWFNQPSSFEGWMMEKRKELFPPEDPRIREQIDATKHILEQRKQKSLEAGLSKQK